MKKNTLASGIMMVSMVLTACGGGSSNSHDTTANQNMGNANVNINQHGNSNANSNNQNANAIGEKANLPATTEDELPYMNFDQDGKLLFGGQAKSLAYQDFVSTDNNLKPYVLNFVQCHGHVCGKTGEGDRFATTGTLSFTIHYENDQWLAKNVQISNLAKSNVNLERYDNGKVVRDVALKSTDLAVDGTRMNDGTLKLVDNDRRIFELTVVDEKVAGFNGLKAQLYFSEQGGFVMSASADLIIAGKRQIGNQNQATNEITKQLWSGSQLNKKDLNKSYRLEKFKFNGETAINSSIKLFDGSTAISSDISQKGFGGYVPFGKAKSNAYMYGYAIDSRNQRFHFGNRIHSNTGAFVVDPSAQLIVGTGGTGLNNLIGKDNEKTFILQR